MRLALVAWDFDPREAEALARLGVEVTAFTRWYEGLPRRERSAGWSLERCPHQLGGGPARESEAFCESIVARAFEVAAPEGFDAVIVRDSPAWGAGERLALRERTTLFLGVVRTGASLDAWGPEWGRWVADHPWTADAWAARHASPDDGAAIAVVPALDAAAPAAPQAPLEAREPRWSIWVPGSVSGDTAGLAEALEGLGRLHVRVIGTGPASEALHQRLVARGLATLVGADREARSAAAWDRAVAASDVLVLVGGGPIVDAAALLAQAHETDVVRWPTSGGARELVAWGLALRHGGERRQRVRSAARMIARDALGPDAVARRWLNVLLEGPPPDARWAGPIESLPTPVLGGNRSRISVLPVSPREAAASWQVRPDDWRTALEWLGADASRAVLVLRVQDITAMAFQGARAHRSWDIELAYGESRRGLGFDRPGLSLAITLGVRGPSGAFLPLARAPLFHLPPEGPASYPASRRLAVLSRRG